MNNKMWSKFEETRERFRHVTENLERSLPKLKSIQQKFAASRTAGGAEKKNTVYTVETPVVYNSSLDDVTIDDDIKLILVADNPGRREQAAENRRYLVGPSGKIAQNFFRTNPALGICFSKNIIILNKTPIHSARTIELRELCRLEIQTKGNSIAIALEESQRTMAALLLEFHKALGAQVWITGYSEMKKGGIFETYTETVKNLYADNKSMYEQIYLFRHFSMNQFTIDLKQQALPGESVTKTLKRIGSAYRNKILG